MILGLGGVIGVVMCGIWTLGFLYPFTAHHAGLRTLELEAHKLESEKLKLEASQLRTAAELSRVRSQLEPHFLLNTLNSIAGLVTQRPREARRLLGCLGDLLRDALSDGDQLQTLDVEVTWLKRYAEILESRHAGFLSFSWHIDEQTRGALVPRLLLQPLLENAVNHGALCRPAGGEVTLRTSITSLNSSAYEVLCVVEDNGPGMPEKPLRAGAVGLRSVRRRLELESEGATLDIESTGNGTRAIIRLPLLLERSDAVSAAS
jgi:sensor histidine kinase YesM